MIKRIFKPLEAYILSVAFFFSVSFDRNGYLYHGRVKSLADGAREAGLNF